MATDRTDDIRAGIVRARRAGWAARLATASEYLERPEDVVIGRAIVDEVRKEMEP